ncbi:thiamine pyrophosphate-binding protein [Microbacterium keratanolyticum]|uniref:thiamine pyrophosphate-binding protein n=1 Tax=Microbacterium keratanolyticum TaxID=67574 RepID=UPI00362D21FE
MTTADDVLDVLRGWQVPYVFCCPGTSETPLLDALADPANAGRGPEFLLTTHEAISVSMADGFARASGEVGVAYLHTNVGLANGLAHLYAAQLARSSVALLTGVKGTATLPHRALTTSSRILDTAAPYSGYTWQNLRGEDLMTDIDRVLWKTTVVPEQPAVLTIPQNHIGRTRADSGGFRRRRAARQSAHADELKDAVALLQKARRPVIIAGTDIARRGAEAEIERIAERLGAPVLVESRRDLERWAFRTDHPHYAGLFDPRSPLFAEADLLVLAGAPTPLEFSAERPILPHGVPLLHIAEDAGEPGRRQTPAASIVGDTGAVLRSIRQLLEQESAARRTQGWLDRARGVFATQRAAWAEQVPVRATGAEFSAASAMRVLAEELPDDRPVVLDAVTSTLPLLRFIERPRRDTLFATASGSLGWGMGAALGVTLARQERTVAVVGDGVVQFGVPALWTASHYRIPATYVVVNNGRYQAVIAGLVGINGTAHAEGTYPLTDIGGVDIAALARSFGIGAERVHGSDELRAALAADRVRSADDGPYLIEVMVNEAMWPEKS